MKKLLLFLYSLSVALMATSIVPDGYYSKANGRKMADLKSSLQSIISKANVLDYGSGAGKTWTGFFSTDRYNGNQVRDRYSNGNFYFPVSASESSASAVSGMNIEHSFPKSWWGGTNNQAYKDLFNLMPSESKINSSKSNYPMGVVTTVKVDNGCTKVGTGSVGSKTTSLWEPADKWKGDFARSYFYMVTAYSNLSWTGEGLVMLEKNAYPTLQKWAYELYLEWCRQDPVDDIERERNEAVYAIQGNRNPFVDFPNLAEYVWGDSVDYAFFIDGTSVDPSQNPDDDEHHDDPVDDIMALLSQDFTADCNGWLVQDVNLPEGLSTVWVQDSKYGMKACSFFDSEKHAAESWLVSPDIDLTQMQSANISFSHAGRYFGEVDSEATLWISLDDAVSWTQLPINTPVLNDKTWTFVDNTTELDAYCGNHVRVGFKYVGREDYSGTWEIKTVKVSGVKKTVEPVEPEDNIDEFDAYAANEIVSSVYSTRFDANWSRYGENTTYTLHVYTKNLDGVRILLDGYPVVTGENTYRVKGLTPSTMYYYQVFVYDENEKLIARSNEVEVDFPEVDPVFDVTPEQLIFSSVPHTPSAISEVKVSLVGTPETTVYITASEPFEVSETSGKDAKWCQDLAIDSSSFVFYVRMASVEDEGDYTGSLILTTKGIDAKTVFLLGSVDCQKAFFEDFEKGAKGKYEEGTVACNATTWIMNNALIAKDSDTNGTSNVRMKGGGFIEMTSDKECGCDSLWFYAGLYNKDTGMSLKVQYSLDQGVSWNDVVDGLTIGSWERHGFRIHQDGSVRLRFSAIGTKRITLDEIQMNDYIKNEQDEETVSLSKVMNDTSGHSVLWDLSGRQVNPTAIVKKGIYLLNGKKVVR